MSFQFYDTFRRVVTKLTPMYKGEVRLYSCGPTVYDYAHIGNFRSYVFVDLLSRSLQLAGFNVHLAVNLTDIDDKIIRAVLEKNSEADLKDISNFTKPYIQAFFDDLQTLRIQPAKNYPRATQNIPQMEKLVESLLEKGYAYKKGEDIYFSIAKDPKYGNLSGVDFDNIKIGINQTSDEYLKDDIRDFVLWKGGKNEGKVVWNSKFGRGRPGWHLECSAMIESIFNGPIDIHTGGVDLIFPHHENELAQSRCGYEHHFVTNWLHCEHLLVDGKKMSKSMGNFYTLRDLLTQGQDPRAIRYMLASGHYRQKLNFTFQSVEAAKQAILGFDHMIARLKRVRKVESEVGNFNGKKLKEDFLKELKNDLNLPKALAIFHQMQSSINQYLDEKSDFISTKDLLSINDTIDWFDFVLDIRPEKNKKIPEKIQKMFVERENARKAKNFALADQLRDKIKSEGFKIIDCIDRSFIESDQ